MKVEKTIAEMKFQRIKFLDIQFIRPTFIKETRLPAILRLNVKNLLEKRLLTDHVVDIF